VTPKPSNNYLTSIHKGRCVATNANQAQLWLQKAAAAGHPAAKYRAGLNQIKTDSSEALRWLKASAAQGYVPAQNYLQQLGRYLCPQNRWRQSAALWFGSASNNRVDQLQKLLNVHNSVDLRDEVGHTPLFNAIEANSYSAFNWLLNKGAKPNQHDTFGNTPLALAIANNRPAMHKQLEAKGGDIKQTLPNGDTLLYHCTASLRNSHTKLRTGAATTAISARDKLPKQRRLDSPRFGAAPKNHRRHFSAHQKRGKQWRDLE
jgi:TPR repeat protein